MPNRLARETSPYLQQHAENPVDWYPWGEEALVPAPVAEQTLTRGPLEAAVREYAQVFDDVHGGIGAAPKFPHAYELAFCLRRYALEGGALSGTIARLTLTKMAEGGIYDHLGGGF